MVPPYSELAIQPAPTIGITVDAGRSASGTTKYESAIAYARAVADAGGVPMLLPHRVELATAYVSRCDGLMLTGGDDPDMAAFGVAMHPQANAMNPARQAFEMALLAACDQRRELPVLGICLGMQLMALHAGGGLHQYLPDVLANPQLHRGDHRHEVMMTAAVAAEARSSGAWSTCGGDQPTVADVASGWVTSWHRQAVSDAGSMRVAARAPDGVVEAIDDVSGGRTFYVGVQWHPERGPDRDGQGHLDRCLFPTSPYTRLNHALVRRFVKACSGAS